MKPADLKLPPAIQARIQVLETLGQLCRGSLRHATPRLIDAYASEIEIIDERLADLRKTECPRLRDNREAAAAAGADQTEVRQ